MTDFKLKKVTESDSKKLSSGSANGRSSLEPDENLGTLLSGKKSPFDISPSAKEALTVQALNQLNDLGYSSIFGNIVPASNLDLNISNQDYTKDDEDNKKTSAHKKPVHKTVHHKSTHHKTVKHAEKEAKQETSSKNIKQPLVHSDKKSPAVEDKKIEPKTVEAAKAEVPKTEASKAEASSTSNGKQVKTADGGDKAAASLSASSSASAENLTDTSTQAVSLDYSGYNNYQSIASAYEGPIVKNYLSGVLTPGGSPVPFMNSVTAMMNAMLNAKTSANLNSNSAGTSSSLDSSIQTGNEKKISSANKSSDSSVNQPSKSGTEDKVKSSVSGNGAKTVSDDDSARGIIKASPKGKTTKKATAKSDKKQVTEKDKAGDKEQYLSNTELAHKAKEKAAANIEKQKQEAKNIRTYLIGVKKAQIEDNKKEIAKLEATLKKLKAEKPRPNYSEISKVYDEIQDRKSYVSDFTNDIKEINGWTDAKALKYTSKNLKKHWYENVAEFLD